MLPTPTILMIINKSGIVIRIVVSELRVMGRATQGVRLITLKGNDEIASVAKIEHEDEVEEEIEEAELADGEEAITPTATTENETNTDNNPDTEEKTEEN
jgi:DNA gyrase subunit A